MFSTKRDEMKNSTCNEKIMEMVMKRYEDFKIRSGSRERDFGKLKGSAVIDFSINLSFQCLFDIFDRVGTKIRISKLVFKSTNCSFRLNFSRLLSFIQTLFLNVIQERKLA